MISLVLNGACVGVEKGNMVALVDGEGRLLAQEFIEGRTGSNLFPAVTARLLESIAPRQPDQVVAVRGPGSFTGLRSSLALAKGLSMGWACPLRAVSLGSALRETLDAPDALILSLARRGYVFVDSPHQEIQSLPIEKALEFLTEDVKLAAGDAVSGEQKIPEIVEKILSIGIMQGAVPYPSAQGIVKAAEALSKEAVDWLPLYIDPPKISRPKVADRPPPIGFE
ncbi:tRNA (adenosine(37)-N6)-threonylcarbamoyltransferase complex dimerization subunit type 1 TsaB [Acetobacteraceae bacterium]|nr:tRNA (adenosine(37)-N6)-threonylcarbamoyltransferase complex dimerization subunit type 1 TsaB [Acetobacteraceae bacterium]